MKSVSIWQLGAGARKTALLAGLMLGLFRTGPSPAADDFLPEETAYYLCAGCHGPQIGAVLNPMPMDIPNIIGQRKDYLLKQLKAYRDGNREHPNMSNPLSNYSDSNLENLAIYYEGLGPKRPLRVARQGAPAKAPPPDTTSSTAPAKAHHKATRSNRKPVPQGVGKAQ